MMKYPIIISYLLLLVSFPFTSYSVQGSLEYNGSNDFTRLPSGLVSSLQQDYSVEMWVYWRGASGSNWQRVFDFGNGTGFNMFLTLRNSQTGTPRFAITQNSFNNEQQITAPSPLSLNTWHHIAVVITHATNTGKLFIDGANVATNSAMTLRPSLLGSTNQNYLGRSQYTSDPYFNGYIDEVRISSSARYTATFSPQQENFVTDASTLALYHFDEGTGQTIYDATGNYNGFRGNTASSESSDPSWAVFTILPVGLQHLKATLSGEAVTISWETAFEQHNKGFHIERSLDGIFFYTIGFVNGAGNVSALTQYAFKDRSAPAGTIWYRLKQEDLSGRFMYSDAVAVTISPGKGRLTWSSAGSGTAEIRLGRGNREPYQVADANGRILQQGNLLSGKTTVSSQVRGVYIISVNTGDGHVLSEMIVL